MNRINGKNIVKDRGLTKYLQVYKAFKQTIPSFQETIDENYNMCSNWEKIESVKSVII